jgi:hypothetical protein
VEFRADAVPNQLHATIVETFFASERSRGVGSFYLKAFLATEAIRQSEVMKQRADRDDFRVMSDALKLSEPHREEPGSDSVIEEKRFGISPGEVHCSGDKWRVDHRNASQDLRLTAHDGRLRCWRHCISLPPTQAVARCGVGGT